MRLAGRIYFSSPEIVPVKSHVQFTKSNVLDSGETKKTFVDTAG